MGTEHWVDRLGWWSGLHLAWGRLTGRWPAGPVHYLAGRAPGWLSWFGFTPDPQATPISLARLRDGQGRNLYFVAEEHLVELSQEVARVARPPGWAGPGGGLLTDFYRVSCAWGPGWPVVADYHTLRSVAAGSSHIHQRDCSLTRRLDGVALWFDPSDLRDFLRELAGVVALTISNLRPQPRPTPPPGPTLAVQAVSGMDPSRSSDLWWLKDNPEFPRDSILIYFNRPDCQPDQRNLQAMAELGLHRWTRWSNLRPGLVRPSELGGYLVGVGQVLLRAGRWSGGFWEATSSLKLLRWLLSWPAFFRRHGVAGHFHVTSDAKGIALRLAADRSGVVDLTHQWSCNHFDGTALNRAMCGRVLFGWGPWTKTMLSCYSLRPQTVEIVGHHNLNSLDAAMRERLAPVESALRRRCRWVLGWFGNVTTPSCYFTAEDTEQFNALVVDYACRNSEIGLVFKGKSSSLQAQPELREPLQRLRSQGRLVELEVLARPFEVALISDAVVGLFCNTAVVESALLGKPAWFLDPQDLLHQFVPPYRLLAPYVAATWSQLEARLDETRRGGCQGWREDILDQIDPFRDGSGGRRAGALMLQCLQEARLPGA